MWPTCGAGTKELAIHIRILFGPSRREGRGMMDEHEESSSVRRRRPWWSDLLVQAGGNLLAALVIALYLSAIGVIRRAPDFFLYQIVYLLLLGLAVLCGYTVGRAIESRRTRAAYYVLTTVSIIVLLWSYSFLNHPKLASPMEDTFLTASLTTSFLVMASIVLFYRSPIGSAFMERINNVWRPKRKVR
jgi:hypothetical protein